MPAARTPETPAFLRVFATPPSPLNYVAGVSPEGTDVPWERAQALLAAGLASTEPPTAVAAPAAPEE